MAVPAGKRVGPPEIAPVIVDNVRVEALHWGRERGLGQNGGYIAAFDTASNREIWVLKVYDVLYDPALEEDVQDIFIESMVRSESGPRLEITDERSRRYTVDVLNRTVVRH